MLQHHTKFLKWQIRKIQNIIENRYTDKQIFWSVAWFIIKISHDINNKRGWYGHNVRQNIRWQLWGEAKKIFPALRKFTIVSEEFNGHMNYITIPLKPVEKQSGIARAIIKIIKFIRWL